MAISAKILLDSVSPNGARLTTMEVVMPRVILAEFNTHRVFSRNSASSRAIPATKMVERVKEDPFVPLAWPSNQAGMVGGANLPDTLPLAATWISARDWAVWHAERLLKKNVHKSLVNRLLEPFLWHTVIVTSTDWENFFLQRTAPDAEIHMQSLAKAMQRALQESTPQQLEYGSWHLPLWANLEEFDVIRTVQELKMISAGRCARVSYMQHDGTRDPVKDVELSERLWNSGHWSPFEHVATPARPDEQVLGNFHGWHQMRHIG